MVTSSSSCTKCVKLLQQVLEDGGRPMSFIEAMGGKVASRTESGVQLQFPNDQYQPSLLRRWSQMAQSNNATQTTTTSTKSSLVSISSKSESDSRTATVAAPAVTTAAAPAMAASAIAASSISSSSSSTSDSSDSSALLSINCRPCVNHGPEGASRAFVTASDLSIVLCSNRLKLDTPNEMEEVLVHELTHIYDVRVQQLDLRNCETLAYSEVRAAREAECKHSWLPGRYCIPMYAFMATSNIFPRQQARQCIETVFDTAMADTKPLKSNLSRAASAFKPVPYQHHSNTWSTSNTPYQGGMHESER